MFGPLILCQSVLLKNSDCFLRPQVEEVRLAASEQLLGGIILFVSKFKCFQHNSLCIAAILHHTYKLPFV